MGHDPLIFYYVLCLEVREVLHDESDMMVSINRLIVFDKTLRGVGPTCLINPKVGVEFDAAMLAKQ